MNLPENQVCSDCTERQPRWASLIVPPPGAPEGSPSFGAFVCLECSGSHRRLGVHITFVRSINLDSWKEKEVMAMENGGNNKVNTVFEARLNVQKPSNQADLNTRERYIRDKYERRKFYDPAAFSKVVAQKSPEPKAPQPVPQQDLSFEADFSNTGSVTAPSAAAQKRLAQRRGSGSGITKERRAPVKGRSKSSVDGGAIGDLLDLGFSNEAPPQRRVQRRKSRDGFAAGDASVASAPDKRSLTRRKSKDNLSVDGGPKRGVSRKKSKDKDLMAFDSSNHTAPAAKDDFSDFAAPAPGKGAEKPKASSQDIMSLYNTSPTPAMNNGSMNMQNNMANMTNMMQQMNMQNNMMAQQQNAGRMAQTPMTPQQMQQQAMMYQQHMKMLQSMQGGMGQPQMAGMGAGGYGGNMMMQQQQQQQMGMMPQAQQSASGQNLGGMGMASQQQPAESKDPFASLGAQGFR